MIARVCYALLAIGLLMLAGVFAFRLYRGRQRVLPVVEAPAEVAGRSCDEGIEKARELTKRAALDRARLVYLWLLSHCDNSPVLPDAMLEAGSLFGHLLHQPREARLVYQQFLRRFPTNPEAGDVTYHLARLEIERGDYTAAIAHLTTLAQRYPNSWHEESGKFLAAKAAEMLAAEKRSRRTFFGQLKQLVPNNLVSLLALLTALGPTVIQTVAKLRESAKSGTRTRWAVPAIVVGLTALNYVMNNVDSGRQNRLLMEKLDHLAGGAVQAQASE
jgi:tetratricopeptide (TPR) repeat protein